MSVSADGLVLERGAAWTAPIYYRIDDCVASSNLTPLIRAGDEHDVERLAAMIAYAHPRNEDRSIYRNIRQVRPFETVVLSGTRRRSTVRPPPTLEPVPNLGIAELASELRRRLFTAIERATGSRRVCVMLGGLDSSSILAGLLALRGARPGEVTQITLDFDAPGSDRPHVRAMETHYGISVARLRPADGCVEDALEMDGAPSRHHGDFLQLSCARRAHEMGAQLLMTGAGGDQLFGGDLGAAVRMGLTQRDLRGAWNAMCARFPFPLSARSRIHALILALLRPYTPTALRRMRVLRNIPDWAGPVLRVELERALRAYAERPAPGDPQARYEDIVTNPADSDYVAETRAQADSVSPIGRADPIYDEDVVQFLVGVRHQALYADGAHRGLLRRAMHGLLPESVRNRVDKSDFEPALTDAVWPIERFRPLLTFESLASAGIVDVEAFRRYLAPLFEAPRAAENSVRWVMFWPALAAEAFLRKR